MIAYDNGSEFCTMTCDTCGEEFTAQGTYKECIEDAKYAEWDIVYDDDLRSYFHYCPDDK